MEEEIEGSRPQSRASSASSRQKTPVELGPIRTGRETPLGERPESASLLLSGAQEDVTEIQMTTSEPLPPIQSKDSADPVDADIGSLSPTLATSEVIAGTMAGSKAPGHLQKPRIVSYRREMEETFLSDSDSSISSDHEGATRKQKRGDGAVSAREVRTVKGQDGGEHTVVSVNCQTEWSWLEDMKTTKTTKKRQAQRRGSSKIGSSARVTSADDSLDSSEELDFSRSSSHSNRRRATTGSGSIGAVTASPVRSGPVEINHILVPPASSLGATSVGDFTAKSGAHSISGLSVHGVQSEASYISNPPVPTPSRDDEYGIPILQMSSDSESSDDDSVYQAKAADEENSESKDTVPTLPSIGPPQILQYQRESKKKKLDADNPENRANEADLRRSRVGGGQRGRYRKSRASRRGGEDGEGQSGEDGEEEDDVGDDPQHISDKDMAEYQSQFGVQEGGIFEGTCEFCGKNIKPFPSMSDQKNLAPAELYCCEDYQEFVQFMVMHPLKEQFHKEKKMIDVKPHRAHGNKQVRKAAKERAAQRMRERELARQQAAMSAPSGGGGGGGGGPANFFQFARQMKTINYQLSSQKCLEEGWTIRAPSPLFDMMPDGDLFEPEPVLPPWAETEGKKRERKLVLKYYDDGSLFIVMFPDGTGNVFYPSGNVAITISSTEKGLFTFMAHEDDSEQAAILAVFDSNGCGASYYAGGSIRLHLDQLGGLELDPRGGKKKRWSWKDQVSHVHAPPIQPITYAITARLALRIVGQDNITLTFSTRRRGCRFQVGARLKLVSAENYPIQLIEEDELYRQEVSARVQSIFNRVSNLLKFPNSPKLDKLPTPPHISARMEKVTQLRTSRAESRSRKKGQGQSQPVTVT